MTDHMGMDCNTIVYMNQKSGDGGSGSPRTGSPRMRSKAKSISWLKQTLQNAGCVIKEGDKDSHVIDDCFQVPLPVLQKYSATLVRTNLADNILNSMAFSDIVKNIWALRSEYVIRIAKPVLQKLMSHDRNRNTFNEPVDPVALGIPNYFSVIKKPMDLGTVMARLRSRQYATIKACFDDIELVFSNAMLFNHATHEVHKMARDLMKEFHADVALAEEKCTKERERREQHNCSLCCGSTCQLCGEKCLKYEPPSLNCQQCGTRVKKNGIFYVCADGSALWCQKCYISLPPVIVAGAPRPLDRGDGTDGPDTASGSGGMTHSSSVIGLNEEVAAVAGQGLLDGDLPCAISSCDSESLHDAGAHAHADSAGSERGGSANAGSFGSNGQDDAPLLKRSLLKRRADEEVAEPWVACDSCGNWYHQICALYSKLGESCAAKSFFCPFCVLLASDGSDPTLSLVDVTRSGVACMRRHDSFADCARSRTSSGADEGTPVDTDSLSHEESIGAGSSMVLSILPPPSPLVAAVSGLSSNGTRLHRGLSVKFEPEDALFKNIFEYSEMSAPHSLACTPKSTKEDGKDGFSALVDPLAQLSETSAMLAEGVNVAFVSANSSCAGTGLTSEDERLLDDESVPGTTGGEDSVVVTAESCAMDTSGDAVVEITVEVKAKQLEQDDKKSRVFSDRQAAGTPIVEPLPPPPVGVSASVQANRAALDTHWKWRASSLPHTQLGDFLQALVQDLLVANGHADAARTVTVRMTTNRDMPLEVPASIVQNMIAPTGHVIPSCLGYKQKCILLFQEIDGVDVCIFSLYVHEFDATCPSPNTSTVYIAYLDSVDFFRPVAARTMVYQELVAGYLKWSQMRGFKQAHIWSCPPHRGDNFIFNAHPAHQKYPSRERLNQWYKAILQRCSRVGVIAETGNLWQQYFSKYVRRDVLPVARQAALNSFVGSGKALKKSNYKSKGKMVGAAAAAAAARATASLSAIAEAPPSTEPTVSSAATVASTSTGDAPVCPPIFDGDYWVQQYVYLVRLHTQRGKAPSTATQRQQLGLRKVRELLKRLMNREESDPFLHPVDHIALDIPNYTLIVKQPMDFSTVKEKLHAGEYPTAAEFAKDVRLIFSNAKLFNPPDHAVHLAADSLAQRFQRGLQLVVAELKELNGGNGLLRMPIPGQDCAHGASDVDAFLATVVLSLNAPKEPVTAPADASPVVASLVAREEAPVTTTAAVSSDGGSISDKSPGKRTCDDLYRTPPCTTVSRSGSLVDEKEFFGPGAVTATAAGAAAETAALPPASPKQERQPPATPVVRSRSQSISITPVVPAPVDALQLLPPKEVEALSDWEMVVDTEEDAALRRMQRVVSQDFTVASARGKMLSDDKRKALEDRVSPVAINGNSESATKRRRLLTGEVVSVSSVSVSSRATQSADARTASAVPDKYQNFSSMAVNAAHVAVPFTAPALGSQNAMTIVAELSKRMQRQYDDLFVIKLAPPSDVHVTEAGAATDEAGADAAPQPAAPAVPAKKMRGRVAAAPKKTPAMHVPGGLKSMGPVCRALLAALTPDTSDPDPAIHSPVTDSRHVFLELCQFRHYQFDSLRRAKHSSLMLLYHLQNPLDKRCHPCCSHCDAQIQGLRWHCDECPNFDLCGNCYTADMARRIGPPPLSRRTSFSVDTADTLEPVVEDGVGVSGALVHPHVLTPYRVSHHW